jgi:hypothetical protein
MSASVQDWLVMGIMFAGAPALALARRWDAVRAGETLPRACGPAPAPRPERTPEPIMEPRPTATPVLAPGPAFLRLGRVDEGMDADRRSRRRQGLYRAGY